MSLSTLLSCGGSSGDGSSLKSPTNAEAFEGVQCSAVRPQTGPDLMAWDSGSRLNLKRLRREGVVAVRYEAEGCNVKLELLSNCIAKGDYKYTAYSANESKVAHNANELYAQLPIGAASLSGKVKGSKALRTDYALAGQYALPPAASFTRTDLQGSSCARATHVVSTVYVGGFALVSGEGRELDAAATVFGVGGGGTSTASVERLANEGNAEACAKAQESREASDGCDVPLRIGLLALGGPDVACPEGSNYENGRCVAQVSTTCSEGLHFVAGKGCVPDVVEVAPAAVVSPAPTAPTPKATEYGMVSIPAGTFMMGSINGDADEKPVHSVRVAAFSLDKVPVTVAAYKACVNANECSNNVTSPYWDGAEKSGGEYCNYNAEGRANYPMNCVDWNQAGMYCKWVGKRLPTEEEWEYAARGTDRRTYPWGSEAIGGRACWNRWDSKEGTCEVGSFPSGASPFGVLDMAGNVWEWTASGYSEGYGKNRANDTRVNRGGSWSNGKPEFLRASYRFRNAPSDRYYGLGFRCAR